jgi:hypothetical protein
MSIIAALFSCLMAAGMTNCSKDTKQQEVPADKDSVINTNGPGMSIGIYVAPGLSQTTDQHYRTIMEANVDLIQDISLHLSPSDKVSMLKMAARYGLKMFVADERVNGTDKEMADMVGTYLALDATAGYYIRDEPVVADLPRVAAQYKRILALDPEKVPHVNLLPNYATGALPNIDYEKEYVEKWIELVGAANLKYLSFDNYPFMLDGTLREAPYYKNLEIIRKIGLKYKIPTSAYLQSIGSSIGLRRPNASELRYSAYTNLAYGIKLPVWFTYWTPVGSTEQFTNAIVDVDGNKTDLYEPFKAINLVMKQLGKTLINLDAVAVYHNGKNLPDGMQGTPNGFVWKAANENDVMLITHFVNPANQREYIMVVNKSLTDNQSFTFNISNTITAVKQLAASTGKETSTNYTTSGNKLTDNFLPGEGKLYALYK